MFPLFNREMESKLDTGYVARLGLGTANLGADYGLIRDSRFSKENTMREASFEVLEAALQCGVRIIDTSSRYGRSESLIAEFLESKKGISVEVISKFSADYWEKESEISRERLGDRLSTLLWHDANLKHPDFNRRLKSMEQAKKSFGSLRLGCSTYGIEAARLILSTGLFETLEIEYNLLNPHVLNAIRSEAEGRGVRIILRSTFQKGFLTDALTSQEVLDLHTDPGKNEVLQQLGRRVHRLAHAEGFKVEELALRYSLETSGEGNIVLFGATSPTDILTNAEIAKNLEPDPRLRKALQGELGQVANEIDPELLYLSHWKN